MFIAIRPASFETGRAVSDRVAEWLCGALCKDSHAGSIPAPVSHWPPLRGAFSFVARIMPRIESPCKDKKLLIRSYLVQARELRYGASSEKRRVKTVESFIVDTIPTGCYTNGGDRAIGVAISNDTASPATLITRVLYALSTTCLSGCPVQGAG